MIGYIPERLCVVTPNDNHKGVYRKYKIHAMFESDEPIQSDILLKEVSDSDIQEAYPVDATNTKRIESAVSWAESKNRGNSSKKVFKYEVPNSPMRGLRIIDLEIRGEGGRAYKVVNPYGFYCDLREDQLMEAMKLVGIEKNAIVNGDWIWASVGAQMKIVLVGSKLYNELIEATKLSKKDPIKDLEVGKVYRNKSKDFIYLGQYTLYETKTIESYTGYYTIHKEACDTTKKSKYHITTQIYEWDKNYRSYLTTSKSKPIALEELDTKFTEAEIIDTINKCSKYDIVKSINAEDPKSPIAW